MALKPIGPLLIGLGLLGVYLGLTTPHVYTQPPWFDGVLAAVFLAGGILVGIFGLALTLPPRDESDEE